MKYIYEKRFLDTESIYILAPTALSVYNALPDKLYSTTKGGEDLLPLIDLILKLRFEGSDVSMSTLCDISEIIIRYGYYESVEEE